MKRFSGTQGIVVESKRIDDFLAEIEQVCKRHSLSLFFDDSFEVHDYEEWMAKELTEADDCTNPTH